MGVAPNVLMPTSSRLDWRTSRATLRMPRHNQSPRPNQRTPSPGASHCPITSHAKTSCSTLRRTPVRAVAPHSIASARASARCWTGCPRGSVSSGFAAPNMAAGPVGPCTRRRSGRSQVGTPALLAQVLVSKYCDHTPLYRQSQIFARHGVELDRSTLAGWVGGACWWLDALHERLCANVFASDHLFADDTPVPVLDPGRGRTKTGRLWVYAREQRGWSGPEPPAAVFLFAPDRKSERPAAHLEHFSGVLHVDGYAGFERLQARGNVVLAACW